MDGLRTEVCGRQKQSNDPRNNQHSPGTPTTGLRERGNDTSRSIDRSGRQNAATRRNMRREERVTVQGPVKEQQPDGMSHGGGVVVETGLRLCISFKSIRGSSSSRRRSKGAGLVPLFEARCIAHPGATGPDTCATRLSDGHGPGSALVTPKPSHLNLLSLTCMSPAVCETRKNYLSKNWHGSTTPRPLVGVKSPPNGEGREPEQTPPQLLVGTWLQLQQWA